MPNGFMPLADEVVMTEVPTPASSNPASLQEVYQSRRHRLRARMAQEGLAALIVNLDANRYYLSGFELKDCQTDESSGCLVLMQDGRDLLCTDSRYHEAACRLWDEDQVFIYRGNAPRQIGQLVRGMVSGPVGYDSRHTTVSFFQELGIEGLCAANGLVECLRVIKEPGEIAFLAASCAINEKMMDWLPGQLVPGKTEAQIAWEIEQFFRNSGAEDISFASIVAVDGNAALPHACPGSTVITDNCSVLVDVGCRLNGYCSDQTRTFWVGQRPDPFFAANLRHVQEAQQKAIAAIRPGIACAEIYNIAMGHLEAMGVGQYFTHGLGHGVGLQTHERPRLAPAIDATLEPGMVVTVEPGVYYPGKLGIRWEHMVVVTEDGHQIL